MWYKKDIQQDVVTRELVNDELKLLEMVLSCLENETSNHDEMKESILSKLQPLYDEVITALTSQCGFIILKSFPTLGLGYSPQHLKQLIMAFCNYSGMPLIQNKKKDLIFDVKAEVIMIGLWCFMICFKQRHFIQAMILMLVEKVSVHSLVAEQQSMVQDCPLFVIQCLPR